MQAAALIRIEAAGVRAEAALARTEVAVQQMTSKVDIGASIPATH
jgi:hypothetical protein